MLTVPAPSVQIIRAVLREYHAATHTAQVEPVLGPASLVGDIPVLMSCRPDLLDPGRDVAVLTWSDVGGLVLGPYGAVPDDPPNAGDADTVDGIHASATATANKLLALNASSKLPASITGDADTVDGIHAAATAAANKLLALNASSKLPASITGDADTVDSIHAATTPTANKLLAMNANAKFPTHTIEGSLTVETDLNVNGNAGIGGSPVAKFDVVNGSAHSINLVMERSYSDNAVVDIFSVDIGTSKMFYGEFDISTHRYAGTGAYGGFKKYSVFVYKDSAGTVRANSIIELADFGYTGQIISDSLTNSWARDTLTFTIQRDHNATPGTRLTVRVTGMGYGIANALML